MRTAKASRNTYPRLEARHFWFIATTIADMKHCIDHTAWKAIAEQFAKECQRNSAMNANGNKTFKPELFRQACGLDS